MRLAGLMSLLPERLKYNRRIISVRVEKGYVRFLMSHRELHAISDKDTLGAVRKALKWIDDLDKGKIFLNQYN